LPLGDDKLDQCLPGADAELSLAMLKMRPRLGDKGFDGPATTPPPSPPRRTAVANADALACSREGSVCSRCSRVGTDRPWCTSHAQPSVRGSTAHRAHRASSVQRYGSGDAREAST
jgi:hypothetical protein